MQPAIAEALILTASLMSAEESYSGRRAEFAQLAWDQVLNGVYITESEKRETDRPAHRREEEQADRAHQV